FHQSCQTFYRRDAGECFVCGVCVCVCVCAPLSVRVCVCVGDIECTCVSALERGREREKEREKQWESESTYHSWREDTQPQVKLLCPHSEPLSSLKLSCLQALSQPVDLSERKISSSIRSFVIACGHCK